MPADPVDAGATEFAAFAGAHTARLRGAAFLLCRDWHMAEDLTQTTLVKLFVGWRRVGEVADRPAYARKVLLRTYLDHRRRRSSMESATGRLPERAHRDSPELRLTMLAALARLPARDRAIVVLRYFEDYSVEQVAAALAIPPGAVKTRTRRSLSKLRVLLAGDRCALFSPER